MLSLRHLPSHAPARASTHRASRWTTVMLALVMAATAMVGCGKSEPPPPVDDSRRGAPQAEAQGMSGTKKVVLLAGAAALYYLYKKHKDAAAHEGPEGQYYLSKNGRVYYRDAEHRAHWVTPPSEGISVPANEAAEYRQFQGYDNSTSGRDLSGLAADPE